MFVILMLILIIMTSYATLVVPGKLARIFEPTGHHVDIVLSGQQVLG